MGVIASCIRRLLCCLAPPAAAGAADDTVFDAALLSVDGEALRSEAHTLGDAAAAASSSSRAAYAAGDGAGAKTLSLLAGTHRDHVRIQRLHVAAAAGR